MIDTLEEFYADPRRKQSREIQFGAGWQSSRFEGLEFQLFWVAATSELCVLRTPLLNIRSDSFLSRFIAGLPPHTRTQPLEEEEAMVDVIGEVQEGDLAALLNGWEEHRDRPDGFDWVLSVTRGLSSPGQEQG